MEVKSKKKKKSILSRRPNKRRDKSEMIKIIEEIQSGVIGKRAACRIYNLNRNTLNNMLIWPECPWRVAPQHCPIPFRPAFKFKSEYHGQNFMGSTLKINGIILLCKESSGLKINRKLPV